MLYFFYIYLYYIHIYIYTYIMLKMKRMTQKSNYNSRRLPIHENRMDRLEFPSLNIVIFIIFIDEY